MKTLVTGGRGMLAQALREILPDALYLGRDELDITSGAACEEVFEKCRPELVFNLAAYTKVDAAESDEERAFAVNGDGAQNIATACRKHGARLLHVSTDYVFDGTATEPYAESQEPSPRSVYGRSKLAGEEAIERELPDSLVVRTSWLYGDGGPNFVDTILQLAARKDEIRVVSDQVGRPTSTAELARALVTLAEGGFRGLCHFACSGETSWYGMARLVLARAGFCGQVVPILTPQFPRPAPRPAYSVLSTDRFERWTGHVPRPWNEALAEFLQSRFQLVDT